MDPCAPFNMAGKNLATIFCSAIALISLSSATSSNGVDWDDFRVKYVGLPLMSGFYKLPRTVNEAMSKEFKKEEWTKPPETSEDTLTTTLCLKDDPSCCIIYDKLGSIAGYQIAIPRAVDKLDMGIDYKKMGLDEATIFGKDMYVTRVYFVPQEIIKSGGREFDGQTGSGLWLKIGSELAEVPTNECDLPKKAPIWIKQNCFDKMGQHYFYNASKEMTPETFTPFFILYSETGELQGFGLVFIGSEVSKDDSLWSRWKDYLLKRNWFELLPSFAIPKIAPSIPDWVLKYVSDFGSFSHHVYFKSNPQHFGCKRDVKCDVE